MYSIGKQEVVSVRDKNKSHAKGNIRKEALRKIAHYLRNERGYSEKKIKKFIAESFIEKINR